MTLNNGFASNNKAQSSEITFMEGTQARFKFKSIYVQKDTVKNQTVLLFSIFNDHLNSISRPTLDVVRQKKF